MSKKTSPKKKETSPRKGVNKKTKSGKPVRGNMSMILIGILMTLSFVANAQLGVIPCGGLNGVTLQPSASASQPGDYQTLNVASAAKYNVISVTTYTNPGTQYIPNRYTYSNIESYYLALADTAGVPTHAPTTIQYPVYLYLCQPGAQSSTLQSYPTTIALGGTATSTVRFDSTYTFSFCAGGTNCDSTQVDSVRFHLYLKYNYQNRTVIVNGDDAISDKNASGANQYLHKAKVPLVPKQPVY